MDIFTDKLSGYQFCMKTGNGCADHIIANGIYEYPLIKWCEQYLTPEGTFVDVGAHMGTYSIILGKKCKEVHSFEAQRSTFDCLTISICVNNAFNIKQYNVALGEKEGSLTLYQVSEDGGGSSLRPEVSRNTNLPIIGEETVAIKTLDSFGLKNVDFLKIDVEGYELDVIKGASMTLIDNNFPPFIFEAWPDDWYKDDKELLLSFVRGLGYKVYPIAGYGNMYLASDHPLRPKKEESAPKVEEKAKYNINTLIDKYTAGTLEAEWKEAINQDKPEDKPGDKSEDKSEGKPEDKSEGKPEDKSEGKPEDKFEGKPEDKFEGKPEDKPEDKPKEDKPKEGKPEDKPKEIWVHEDLQDDDKVPWDVWHILAKHFRLNSKHQDSYNCAMKGLEAAHPLDIEHLLYEEISIVAYYIDKKAEGFEACEKVVLSAPAPWNTRNQTLSNAGFYMPPLKIKSKMALRYNMATHYEPSSSSIIPWGVSGAHTGHAGMLGDGFRIMLRGVNYSIDKNGGYHMRHGDNIVRTLNYLLDTDKNFKVLRGVEIHDKSGVKLHDKNILGMEDLRLFGDKYFLCTYPQLTESNNYRVAWGTYDDQTGEVTRIVPLMPNYEVRCEKNWLPFMNGDKIYIIYAIGPFQLYELNPENGEMTEIAHKDMSENYINDFRGSAPPIPYKDGWLATIHQVYYSTPRKYFHRFVFYDKEFKTMKYSKPFYIVKPGIEFNLSICHSDNGLLMTYSHHDADAHLAVVDYEVVDEMLGL